MTSHLSFGLHREIVNIKSTPEDTHYVEDCTPDLYFPTFGDIDVDSLASLEAPHVLVDIDGTLTVPNARFVVNDATTRKLEQIAGDTRFSSLDIATENGAHPNTLAEMLGSSATARVFQPFVAGKLGEQGKTTAPFWRKILFELDCLDDPSEVVLIGDSLARDIKPAQDMGMRTVLVDRLEERIVIVKASK